MKSTISRRTMLGGLVSLLAAASLPRKGALAGAPPGGRRFLFVYNPGGWDPLCVFAPAFDSESIDISAAAQPAAAGGIAYVDHPGRPSVRAFFDAWHDRTVLLNGVSVPSVSHEVCTLLSMTGTSSGSRPDWPTLVGAAAGDAFTIPSLVLNGPSFPGELGVASARTGANGQLQALLTGNVLANVDPAALVPFSGPTDRVLDRYARARAKARAEGAVGASDIRLSGHFQGSLEQAGKLKDMARDVSFASVFDFRSQLSLAVDLLASGVCRATTVASPGANGTWDTHANNDDLQNLAFESLFAGLGGLMRSLATRVGPGGAPLIDDTVVVVLSEMGRTPKLNGATGRDHWPYTSVMLIGSGLSGDRTIGRFDDGFFGVPIVGASGDESGSGTTPSAESLGATLLLLADADPKEWLPSVEPLGAALS